MFNLILAAQMSMIRVCDFDDAIDQLRDEVAIATRINDMNSAHCCETRFCNPNECKHCLVEGFP